MDVITSPCLDYSETMLVKAATGSWQSNALLLDQESFLNILEKIDDGTTWYFPLIPQLELRLI